MQEKRKISGTRSASQGLDGVRRIKSNQSLFMKRKVYESELAKLQIELVKLLEWIKYKGVKVVIIFEGRNAAGKGGVIRTITECLNPRFCRIVALGMPTEKEKTQWYFQRYVPYPFRQQRKLYFLNVVGITAPV